MGRFRVIVTEIAFYGFLLYGLVFGIAGIVRRKLLVKRGLLVEGWKAVIAGLVCIVMVLFLLILVGELICVYEFERGVRENGLPANERPWQPQVRLLALEQLKRIVTNYQARQWSPHCISRLKQNNTMRSGRFSAWIHAQCFRSSAVPRPRRSERANLLLPRRVGTHFRASHRGWHCAYRRLIAGNPRVRIDWTAQAPDG